MYLVIIPLVTYLGSNIDRILILEAAYRSCFRSGESTSTDTMARR